MTPDDVLQAVVEVDKTRIATTERVAEHLAAGADEVLPILEALEADRKLYSAHVTTTWLASELQTPLVWRAFWQPRG